MVQEKQRNVPSVNPNISWFQKITATTPRWLLILLIFPLIVLNGWLLLGVIDYFYQLITTFLAATLLAFLLSYPTQGLQKLNLPRTYAVLIVFVAAVTVFSVVALLSFPLLVEQFETLRDRVPIWAESAEVQLEQLAKIVEIDISDWGQDFEQSLQNQLQSFVIGLPNLALGTIGNLFQVLFILILTVFLSIFYQGFLANTVEKWFPETAPQVLRSLRRNFNSYIINQFTLAVSLTAVMIPTFWALQVPLYLLFGLAIGIMGVIPFGAIITIFIVGLLLSLKSIWLGLKVLTVALIIDQIIENSITPRLLGTLTGLNPIVVLFSLMVGVKLSGYLGVLIAVPIAATIKSTVRLLSQKQVL